MHMIYRLLIVSLTSLAIVASCSPAKDVTINKNTYSEKEIIINHQIQWLDLLKQDDNHYIVFVYSETCGLCHDMLDEIVAFATDEIMPTYFVDTSTNDVPRTINAETDMASIDEVSIIGTPTIIEIEQGKVISNIPGLDDCLSFLNEKRMNKT